MTKQIEVVRLSDGTFVAVRPGQTRYVSFVDAEWAYAARAIKKRVEQRIREQDRNGWDLKCAGIYSSWKKRRESWQKRKHRTRQQGTWKSTFRFIHSKWLMEIDRARNPEQAWKQWAHNRCTNSLKRISKIRCDDSQN
jgi:hypothetical protein